MMAYYVFKRKWLESVAYFVGYPAPAIRVSIESGIEHLQGYRGTEQTEEAR
jgi:hypothetical protein